MYSGYPGNVLKPCASWKKIMNKNKRFYEGRVCLRGGKKQACGYNLYKIHKEKRAYNKKICKLTNDLLRVHKMFINSWYSKNSSEMTITKNFFIIIAPAGCQSSGALLMFWRKSGSITDSPKIGKTSYRFRIFPGSKHNQPGILPSVHCR